MNNSTKPQDINVPQSVKSVEETKTSTNSPIGSSHWFFTLTSRALHIGEFMINNDELGDDLQKSWGRSLYRAATELNKGFKLINPAQSRISELEAKVKEYEEALEKIIKQARNPHRNYKTGCEFIVEKAEQALKSKEEGNG